MDTAAPDATGVGCRRAWITARRDCGPDAFVLEVEVDDPPPPQPPGRFAMLSPWSEHDLGPGPVIPRPFSIYQRPAPERFTFLVQVLGPGTRALDALSLGDHVALTLPLGNGFVLPPPERPVVLVAGGVGSAPFFAYLEERRAAGAGERTWLLYGARSAPRLYDLAAFAALGTPLLTATDEGDAGFHGSVLDLLATELDAGRLPADARFAACGPEGLLHAFARFCRVRGLDAEVSLETYMGCGFGVCNACAVATDPDGPLGAWPWAKTCVDGPVFALEALAP